MSQFEAPPSFGDQTHSEPAKTSGLAVTSLVCSLIVCCPLVTIFGPLLGVIAVATIGSNPARKGKGLALAGILIGLITTGVWVGGIVVGKKAIWDPMMEGPAVELRAAFDGDYDTFRAGMMGGANTATDEEIEAFVTELRDRYGNFVSMSFDMTGNQQSQTFATVQTMPYIVVFENNTLNASIDYAGADPATQQFGAVFDNIVIHDDGGQPDVSLPAPAAGGP
jgi:hypothetical protein